VKWVCLHCTFALNVMSLPISEFSSYHCNITRRLSKIYVLWNRHLLKWTLNQNNPVDTGCSTKHDSSKTTWRSSLIFDTCCIFCQPNLRNKILEYNYLKQYYSRYEKFRSDFDNFDFILQGEIWTKLLLLPVVFKAQKKADHIYEMLELGEFSGYCFKNHPR